MDRLKVLNDAFSISRIELKACDNPNIIILFYQ